MAFAEQFNYLVPGHLLVSPRIVGVVNFDRATADISGWSIKLGSKATAGLETRIRKIRPARRVYKDNLKADKISECSALSESAANRFVGGLQA